MLPGIYEDKKNDLKRYFKNSKVSICADETTDKVGRPILNIIAYKLDFKYGTVPKLLDTIFLNEVNYQTISKSILDTIYMYGINTADVVAFISDNGSCMKKAYNSGLKLLFPSSTHIRCFAHIMALVGETWRESLVDVDKVVANVKSVFARSSLRRTRFIEHLKREGIENPKRFPAPVITRWLTWFKAVKYISEYYDLLESFVNSETDDTAALTKLQESLRNIELKEKFEFISANCNLLCKTLVEFESQSLHSTEVYEKISAIYFWIQSQYDHNTNIENNDLGTLLFKKAGEKLKKYFIDGEQTGMNLFSTAQIFHPLKFKKMEQNLEKYTNVLAIHLSNQEIIALDKEWETYSQACKFTEDCDNFDLSQWWTLNQKKFPNIFNVASW